jgi:hypothetical protein
MIETRKFNEWTQQEQLDASLSYAALHIKTVQLLDLGILRKVPRK